MTHNDTVQALIVAMQENRDGIRQFAMRRLVNMGAVAVPELIPELKNPDETVQECAAIVLRTIGQAALPLLVQTLRCEDRKLRWGAAWVLSSMGPEAREAVMMQTRKGTSTVVREVSMPSTPAAALNQGVWSDSWLTKVRDQLHTAREGLRIDSVRVKPS